MSPQLWGDTFPFIKGRIGYLHHHDTGGRGTIKYPNFLKTHTIVCAIEAPQVEHCVTWIYMNAINNVKWVFLEFRLTSAIVIVATWPTMVPNHQSSVVLILNTENGHSFSSHEKGFYRMALLPFIYIILQIGIKFNRKNYFCIIAFIWHLKRNK